MNKLVYSALALTLVSTPGLASENEWSSLDQEIESLSSSLSAQNATGPKVNGWVIASFRASDDIQVAPSGNDQQGFFLESARIEITGDAGSDYSYKVSFELSGGLDPTTTTSTSTGFTDTNANGVQDVGEPTDIVTSTSSTDGSSVAQLADAYASAKIADGVNLRMGRFKQPFLRSGLISDNRLLFLDRTILGDIFRKRDLGLMFYGSFDALDWYIAAQNGLDGAGDEYLFTGRVAANLLGSGTGKVEGAYGAGDESNLTVAGAIADDGTISDGLHWALEAAFAQGPFSVAGELVDFDSGDSLTPVAGFFSTADGLADTTPWDVTASYMFTDMYEFAVRYQDFDDDADTRSYGAVINRYVQGHDIKWLVQYQKVETDTAGVDDVDEFGLGLAVSF